MAGTTVTVDDLSARFGRTGSGWREGNNGYANHHFWSPARQRGKVRSGAWRPVLSEAGYYKVQVMIPRYHATTRKAAYKIRTATGWQTIVRNQYRNRGRWVTLGVFQLTTTPMVIVTDLTGEATRQRRRLAYDAARFVPIEAPAAAAMDARSPTATRASSGGRAGGDPSSDTSPGPASLSRAPTAVPGPEPIVQQDSRHLEPAPEASPS